MNAVCFRINIYKFLMKQNAEGMGSILGQGAKILHAA